MASTLQSVWNKLSWLDRLLPLLIILSMMLGILLSVYVPSSRTTFESSAQLEGVSLPLAIGLLIMMVPPLCKIEWENISKLAALNRKSLLVSLVINWIVGPFVMFGLAWMVLYNEPEYRTGIILIGLARCIAMVMLWNDLATGNNNLCALVVLINSLLQIVLFAPYHLLFNYAITGESLPDNLSVSSSYSIVAKSVAIYLGIPFVAGFLIRFCGLRIWGKQIFEEKMLLFISPWAAIGLLYTIIVMFIERGYDFIKNIGSAFKCFIPLTLYFLIMWFGVFYFLRWFSHNFDKASDINSKSEMENLLCGCEDWIQEKQWNKKLCKANYADTMSLAFTAASNNFELSLAVAIVVYGLGSKQAIAATFGPLLEVPILLALTYVGLIFKEKYIWLDVKPEVPREFVQC